MAYNKALPTDSNSVLFEGVYDPSGHQFVATQAGTPSTDAAGNISAPQMVQASDGNVATLGTMADSAYASGNGSVVALLKGVFGKLAGVLSTKVVDSNGTNMLAVDAAGKVGINNFPATQAISAASLPLPSNGAQESGGNLASIASNTAHNNPVAGYVTTSSAPSATTAATDTSYAFSSQVNHWVLQNNTSANVQFELDSAASAGSLVVAPGTTWLSDVPVTTIHLYTAAAQNINGASGGNIVIKGWL